jgi:MFS family permease
LAGVLALLLRHLTHQATDYGQEGHVTASTLGRTGLGPDFGRVWFATGTTAVGAQMAQLAMPLLAVLSLHASSAEVGLLGAAHWVPFLLVSLPLGVVVDRRRRKPLLVTAEVVRASAIAVVLLLGALDVLSLPSLVLLAMVAGCGAVLYEITYQSFLPTVVPRERLDAANSRLQATEATAVVAGPGLGGLLVQAAGALPTLGVTAVASLVSALSLSRMRSQESPPDAGGRRSMVREVAEGMRFLRRDRVLAGLLGFSAISNPFAQWVVLLFLLDAVRRLHLNSGQVGLVLAVGAVGTLVGAAASPMVSRRIGPLRTILLTSAVDPLALFVLPLAEPEWGTALLIGGLGAAFAVNGVAVGLDTVVVATIRQRRIPDHMRGRVNAATRLASYGSIALGAAVGGWAGEALGVRKGLALGCLGALATIIWVIVWAVRVHRHGDELENGPREASSADGAEAAPR